MSASSGDVAVRLDGVTIRYGSHEAVSGLELEIGKGELFGLLGPNGAGKSTTLKLLVGEIVASAGRVTILGRDARRGRAWAEIKPRIGYVPDRDNHFEELSGRRNLRVFAELYRVAEGRVDECLARVELSEAADVAVKAYSQGMRRKLLLARALLHAPSVLYLDEPTANLDVHSTELVHEVLRELCAAGTSVLVTTHDMDEVEKICDRVAVLRSGRRIALGTPAELRRDHARRLVDVLATDGGRHVFDLDVEGEREALAELVREGRVSSVHSRSADLRAAFLELTGEKAN